MKRNGKITDPITAFISSGNQHEVRSMLVRLIDFLKEKQITTLFTNLASGAEHNYEESRVGVSSLIDTWLLLQEIGRTANGIAGCTWLNRGAWHTPIRSGSFLLTRQGVKLVPVYLGIGGVFDRFRALAQEACEKAEALAGRQETERKWLELERKRKDMQAQIPPRCGPDLRPKENGSKRNIQKTMSVKNAF